ncbi:MAG: hypothetical protein HYR94_27610, partial [Chloroflexi bacterium]|nr:hypothetical protein [Chloroflexota bacterium]
MKQLVKFNFLGNVFKKENIEQPSTLSENKRKGKIFSYFVGAVWILTIFDLGYNLYVLRGVGDQGAQEYAEYIPGGV